jgi:hypothetical protein
MTNNSTLLMVRRYASLSIIAVLLWSLPTLSMVQPHSATAAKPVIVKNYQICEIPDGSSSETTCVNDLTLTASQISGHSVKIYIESDQSNLCSTTAGSSSDTTTCSNSFTFTLSEVSATKVKIEIKTDQLNSCSTTGGSSSDTTTCTNDLTLTLSGINPPKLKVKFDGDQLNLCTASSGTTTCSNIAISFK